MKSLIFLLLSVTCYASELFESDMILTRNQALEHYGKKFVEKYSNYFDGVKGRHLAGLISTDEPWKSYRLNGKYIVPYTYPTLDEDGNANLLQESSKTTIETAMRNVENAVKYVVFVPKDSSHTFWLNIGHFTDGCYSYVGKASSKENTGQKLNLDVRCITNGIIQHELLHALGLYHEQSRSDRDSFIQVKFQNINPEDHPQFEKQTIDTSMGIEYDYGSVMHYGPFAFSNNTQKTIESSKAIGQRDSLSTEDSLLIKYLYRCTYHDKGASEHCTVACPCPDGFTAHCSSDAECEGNIGCQNVTGLEPHITSICGGTQTPTAAPTSKPTNTLENVKGIWEDFVDLYTDNLQISIVLSLVVASSVFSLFRWLLCSPAVLYDKPLVIYKEKESNDVASAMKYIL